jgi:hypothetical protein
MMTRVEMAAWELARSSGTTVGRIMVVIYVRTIANTITYRSFLTKGEISRE